MIGVLFLFYNIIVISLVLVELYIPDLFIDYYQFRSLYYDEIWTFLARYIYSLIVFFISWIFFRKIIYKTKGREFHIPHKYKYSGNARFLLSLFLVFINFSTLFLQYGGLVFERTEYHPENINHGVFYMLYIASLVGVLAFLLITSSKLKIQNILLVVFVVVMSYSISTRITGVILIFIGLIYLNTGYKLRALSLGVFGFISLVLATYFRDQELHGLYNYFKEFEFSSVFDYMMSVISYAFNFSFYLSIATYHDYLNKGVELNDFVVSLNPMPGVISGWYGYYQDKFLVQHNVPSSAMGTILATGEVLSIFCFALLGWVIAFIEAKSLKQGKGVYFLVSILGCMFIVYFAQYQLRSAFRYIYYALFIVLFIFLKRNIKLFPTNK